MTTKTFKRYELKYFVTQEQYDTIALQLAKRMVYDKFSEDGKTYTIYNIYFDTENDDVIRHSISKPYYKEKLRLRSYKMPTSADDTVFLELKKKIGGIVAKRRAVMSYTQAMDFIESGIPPQFDNYQDTQVVREISDFLSRYSVIPRVFISYERVAFFAKNDSDFRVSFDRNILTRRNNVDLKSGDYGAELLPDGRYIMEVKCCGAIPLWLCSMLSELGIYKTSFSKYGTEYKNWKMSLVNAVKRIHKAS